MNIETIDDMIAVLNKAKSLIGGDAPISLYSASGGLNLEANDNIFIENRALVINTSDMVMSPYRNSVGTLRIQVENKIRILGGVYCV